MRVHPTRGCPWLWLSGTIFPDGDRLPANESLQRGASWARGRLEARKSVLARPVLQCTSVYIAKRDSPTPFPPRLATSERWCTDDCLIFLGLC